MGDAVRNGAFPRVRTRRTTARARQRSRAVCVFPDAAHMQPARAHSSVDARADQVALGPVAGPVRYEGYAASTEMRRGWTCGCLGMLTSSTPLVCFALMDSVLAVSGSVKRRRNEPLVRSMRS